MMNDQMAVTFRKRFGLGSAALGLAGGLLVVAVVLSIAPAFACTVQSHLQALPGRADPGAVVRVEGAGFEPGGTPVNVFWGGETTGALLASVPAPTGNFAVDVTIPANALPGREYLLSATQASSPPHEGGSVFRTSRAAPTPQPEAAAQPAALAQPASVVPAPAPQPVPAAQPQRAEDPKSSPVDASGFASSGASAYAPGTQPVAPLVVDQRQAFGRPAHAAGTRSPWVLVPLGVIGLALFSVAGASVVRQTRSQGVPASI